MASTFNRLWHLITVTFLVSRTWDSGTPPRRVIHVSDCRFVPSARGPRWREFDTIKAALEWAKTTGDPVKRCGHCQPVGVRDADLGN